MINLRGIGKTFNRNGNSIEALKDINLEINKGDIFGVIGFSGAGKSTLLRLVNGLEKPTTGKVIVDGKDLGQLSNKELRNVRKKIGMIFQHFNLLNSKTVFDNIAIPLILNHTPKDEIKKQVNELLEFVDLSNKADSYPDELSGGQKQRVGIARALATRPSILLCDEATSALDPKTTEDILQLIKKINKEYKITILLITHEMNVVREVCNKVAVMEKGRIIEEGNLKKIFIEPREKTTRNFIKTVVNDELPESMYSSLRREGGRNIYKLRFFGENSRNALISEINKTFNIETNILFATVIELQDNMLGNLIVQLKGESDEIQKTYKYLIDRKVVVEEVVV